MRFAKLHGCGNDYVFVDARDAAEMDAAETSRRIADRRCGVGSDGLILVEAVGPSAIRVEMYNADGSRAPMCGNGVRCAAKFAIESELITSPARAPVTGGVVPALTSIVLPEHVHFPDAVLEKCLALAGKSARSAEFIFVDVATDSGPRPVAAHSIDGIVGYAAVDMAVASFDVRSMGGAVNVDADRVIDHPLEINGKSHQVTCVSLGNIHAAVFVDDLSRINVAADGSAIESCGWFPAGANVHFAQIESPNSVRMGIWERGSGITAACGSGACAVVAAGYATQRTASECEVRMPGGSVHVIITNGAYLIGPTQLAFRGEWARPPQ